MKNLIYLLILMIFSFGCKKNIEKIEINKTVFLKGDIINYDQDTLYMSNLTSLYQFLKEDVSVITLKDKTSFEYKFDLEKPTYFFIGRTFLYLSPGDSLVANLDSHSRKAASFKGIGAEANNYLRNLPYPKGGSFWGDDDISSKIKNYKEAPEAFKKSIKIRTNELDSIPNISEDFKRLEKARIKFDYVNSLDNLGYLYYSKVYKGEMTEAEMETKIEEGSKYLIPYKKPFLDDFNNTDYLQLEVFQSILYNLNDEDFIKNHELPELIIPLQEYLTTSNLLDEVRYNGFSNEIAEQLNEGAQKVTNKKYARILQDIQKEYETVTKGNPAFDATLTKLDGSKVNLSNYKGKVIVLDLWATWCSPCMDEKPFFEALEKKYHGNKNIELISVSIDTEKRWHTYFEKNEVIGNQLQIDRSQLSNYKVYSIPRFFIIDKDFNIVDVFAPLPSSGDLEKLINQYI